MRCGMKGASSLTRRGTVVVNVASDLHDLCGGLVALPQENLIRSGLSGSDCKFFSVREIEYGDDGQIASITIDYEDFDSPGDGYGPDRKAERQVVQKVAAFFGWDAWVWSATPYPFE